MERILTLSFAQAPDRQAKALNEPIRISNYPIPYAKRSLLDHAEAHLYLQLVEGWQFTIYLYTAETVRGQAMQLQLSESGVLFVYQLRGYIYRLLYGGASFRLEKGTYCGCYLPAGNYLFNLPPGHHETLLVALPYGYLVWLMRHYPELHPLTTCWKTNANRVLCLPKATIQQEERRTIQRIRNCPKRNDELDGALKVYLARLLALYDGYIRRMSTKPSIDSLLAEVQTYIETHYADKYLTRLNVISHRFGLSATTLRLAYTANHGTSITSAVSALRINAAKQLLRETDLPLAAIAEQTGFDYAESLLRAFKRETGLTPMAYREQR